MSSPRNRRRLITRCWPLKKSSARHTSGLPPSTPPKAKAKRAPTVVSGPSLAEAKVVTAAELPKVDAQSVVALDLSVPWDAKQGPSPDVLAKLPVLPLRALGMCNNVMKVVPKEVLACSGLEVLSLAGTRRVRFPNDLAKLSLRAFAYDYNPRGTKAEDFALVGPGGV